MDYSTEDLDQIGAGSYTLIVEDENGCAVTTTVVLEEIRAHASSVSDQSLDTIYTGYGVSCNGATDGSIDITVLSWYWCVYLQLERWTIYPLKT